jgi:hypothetical protein
VGQRAVVAYVLTTESTVAISGEESWNCHAGRGPEGEKEGRQEGFGVKMHREDISLMVDRS